MADRWSRSALTRWPHAELLAEPLAEPLTRPAQEPIPDAPEEPPDPGLPRMDAVTRWFRILVIALLLPAYGLAAVGSTPSLAGLAVAQQELAALAPATGVQAESPAAADVAALLQELGDTSDDMSDHCLPHVVCIAAAGRPAVPVDLGRAPATDAPPGRLLRPPK